MATDTNDLEVNFDEIDRLKAEDKTKSGEKPEKVAKTDDIVIEKDGDEPEKPAKPTLSAEDGLAKLKKQLDESEAARVDAERRAREAAEGERQAKTEVQASQLDTIKTGIETATQNKAIYKQEYAAALAAQDFDKAADVQEKMSENAANLLYLSQSKAQLERAPKPVTRAPVDQLEEFAGRLSPKSADWVRAHPEFVRDPKKNRQMLAAHELATARGLAADTPEYFASINRTLDVEPEAPSRTNGDARHTEVDLDATTDAAAPVRERSPPAAAPVSRSGGGQGSKPRTIRLTAAEVEMAENMQMSPEEYGRHKLALIKDGKMN